MNEHNILGAILAGGQSKRMGQDKLFLELNNRKLIEYTIDKVKKYLKNVIIITNQKNEFFLKKNLITVEDCIKGQLGPLVGILTAMKWAKENLKGCSWIATFPCDTPFFPETIIQKFIEKSKQDAARHPDEIGKVIRKFENYMIVSVNKGSIYIKELFWKNQNIINKIKSGDKFYTKMKYLDLKNRRASFINNNNSNIYNQKIKLIKR